MISRNRARWQNGINQARSFKEIIDITGIVLTKLDGTAKGGIVLGIKEEIDQLISRYDIAYSFSVEYKQYVIYLRTLNPHMKIMGTLSLQIPNCMRYYGPKINM